MALALEFAVKYALQFILAMISVVVFFKKGGRHESTDYCDSDGKNNDTKLAIIGTALFWVTVLPLLHLALKGRRISMDCCSCCFLIIIWM